MYLRVCRIVGPVHFRKPWAGSIPPKVDLFIRYMYILPLSTSVSSGRTESIKSIQYIPDMRRKNKAEIFGLVLDTCTTRIRAIPDAKNQKKK